MVPRLTPQVISRAVRDISTTDAGRAAQDPDWQETFCAHLVEEVNGRRLRSDADRVAFVATELLQATLRLTTPTQAVDLACSIATTWLEDAPWRLVLEPNGVETLGDQLQAATPPATPTGTADGVGHASTPAPRGARRVRELINAWVGTHVVHRASGRLVSGRIFDPTFQTKLVFIATRVSNVPPTGREKIRLHSENLARVAFAAGAYRCHQTAILSDPGLPTSHDPEWRGKDEDVIAVADLLVIIWDAPSDGFGSLVEMARQYRIPWVIAKVGAGNISPMLLGGQDQLPPIFPAATYIQEFSNLLHADALGLERRQQNRRASLEEARRDLADIRQALAHAEPKNLADPNHHPLMSRSRFRRLINNPSLWRAATGLEQAEIRALARWAAPLLFEEARALSNVVETLLLPREQVREIEHQGRREKALAAAGHPRFDAQTPQDWLRLINNMRGQGLLS